MNRLLLITYIFLPVFLLGSIASAQSERDLLEDSVELYKDGNYTESSKILIKLIKQNPKKQVYWLNLANCSFMEKKFDKAQMYYQKVIALNGPLTPAAKLYLVKTLKATGKTKEASALLSELSVQKLPASLAKEVRTEMATIKTDDSTEEAALVAYQAGRFEDADRLLTLKPENQLSNSARLLMALTFIRLNKVGEAEVALNNFLKQPQLSKDDRQTASGLLRKVRRHDLENTPYWAYVDVSTGTTNNAYLDAKSSTQISSSVTRGVLGLGYEFNQGERWSEKLGYIYSYENPVQAPELKTSTHTVQAPLLLNTNYFNSSLAPYYQQQSWNDVAVSTKTGLAWKNSYMDNSLEGGLDVDVSSQSAANATYSYLSGSSYSVRPYIGYWNDNLYGQIYWLLGSDGTQDITYSDGSTLPLKHSYQGPGIKIIWKISADFLIQGDVATLKRTYSNPALPSGVARVDTEKSGSVKLSYSALPTLSVYLLGESVSNSSTLKAYDATIYSLGFSWEIF